MKDFYYTPTEKDMRIISEGLQKVIKKALNDGKEFTYSKGTVE